MDAAINRESDAVHAWMVELGEMKGSANTKATGGIAADKQHRRVNPNREAANLLVELLKLANLQVLKRRCRGLLCWTIWFGVLWVG